MLNELSPVPLYHQLQHIVRERIESGEWPVGQPIPTESELCEEFNVSRATVTRAMQALVRDGLVRRRRGRGSFAARRISHDLLTFSSFSAYVRQQVGRALADRLLSATVVPATQALAEALDIDEGEPVVEIRKIKLAEGYPVFLANLYVPRNLCPGLEEQDLSSGSVIELLQERYRLGITRVKGSFNAVLVGPAEAGLLEVERGTPAILYHRVRFTGEGRPVMVSDHLIRSDMCQLCFDIAAAPSR
jgi:GntR family transcriptional regulator